MIVCNMKKVRFGENTIIEVENISKYLKWNSSFSESLIRNIRLLSLLKNKYTENRRLKDLSDIIKMICEHADLKSIDIILKRNDNDLFFKDFSCIMKIVMDTYSLEYTLNYGCKNEFHFNDEFEDHFFGEDMEYMMIDNS